MGWRPGRLRWTATRRCWSGRRWVQDAPSEAWPPSADGRDPVGRWKRKKKNNTSRLSACSGDKSFILVYFEGTFWNTLFIIHQLITTAWVELHIGKGVWLNLCFILRDVHLLTATTANPADLIFASDQKAEFQMTMWAEEKFVDLTNVPDQESANYGPGARKRLLEFLIRLLNWIYLFQS